uniref:Gypsy retrotransposon integrase-like protein 1 n=1 Tax=Latimeria chalumnae TaxID=7897 RepID=H3A6B2_LATCH
NENGVSTDPTKVEPIQNWPRCINIKEVLCSYCRRFVANFATIARPLHQLRRHCHFYGQKTVKPFSSSLKRALLETPVLAYPLAAYPFILDTDASNTGVGAILAQPKDGLEHVVGYYSQSLSRAERNCCMTRRELLAIIKAIECFHHLPYGRHFVIWTDHASLQWLLRFQNPEGQIARLQQYDFTVVHQPGKKQGKADALSPTKDPIEEIPSVQTCTPVSRQQSVVDTISDHSREAIRNAQRKDPVIGLLLSWKATSMKPSWNYVAPLGHTEKAYGAQWISLEVQNGVLYYANVNWGLASASGTKGFAKGCIDSTQSTQCRSLFGVTRTLNKLLERFYWQDVKSWCRKCDICAPRKGPTRRAQAPLQQYNVSVPMERVAVDILGPLPTTDTGICYLLTAIDYFNKWPEAYPLKNQEAITVAEVLVNIFTRFGVPAELHSDQGHNFESEVFKDMCRLFRINKTTTPLWPQSDGMVERYNQFGTQLAMLIQDHQCDWDYIPLLLMVYRTAINETTRCTPALIMFGRELHNPTELLFGSPEDERQSLNLQDYEKMETVHEFARQHLTDKIFSFLLRYDVGTRGKAFQKGDLVWLYNLQRRKGKSPKLSKNWEGPDVVL